MNDERDGYTEYVDGLRDILGEALKPQVQCESKESILRHKLESIARQLRKWAAESRAGGWSTHQVDPMRRLADEIDEILLG